MFRSHRDIRAGAGLVRVTLESLRDSAMRSLRIFTLDVSGLTTVAAIPLACTFELESKSGDGQQRPRRLGKGDDIPSSNGNWYMPDAQLCSLGDRLAHGLDYNAKWRTSQLVTIPKPPRLKLWVSNGVKVPVLHIIEL